MLRFIGSIKERLGRIRGTLDMMVIRPIFPPKLPTAIQRLDCHGKRVLVSGSSSGVGYQIATYFAGHGAEVHMLCRNAAKAIRARDEIRRKTGNEEVHVEIVEMSSLKSVRDFVDRWAGRSPEARSIDILMNNAGLAAASKRTTEDGFELTYQTNFLSCFLLTTSLLRRSCFTAEARIVQTASHGVYGSGPLDPSVPKIPTVVNNVEEGARLPVEVAFAAYSTSKGAQVVWTKELQDRLANTEKYKNVVVQSANPGWVSTPIWDDPSGFAGLGDWIHEIGIWMDSIIGITPSQGAAILVYLATSKEAALPAVRGKYWDWLHVKWSPAWMEDRMLRQALWKRWEEEADIDASF
ncbi:hypothetical protein FRB94_011861 [Tulasnella sp. JGI-2019a]|nr:hypothetical protein FRB94_011861 [Tulasnella sp. JGI-2019a]KAG9014452.1 hypothetical protein FRB93_013577 [Tulasnella sp. JGI-2019a]KAG9039709.1 hypothetical protein FRB95_007136 [Tulasnella sp. JGI-2019a]